MHLDRRVGLPWRRARRALLVGLVLCASCSKEPVATPAPPAVPSIIDGTLHDGEAGAEASTAELIAALGDPKAIVLDARAPEEFAISHVPGARNVPGKPGLPPSKYTADVAEVERRFPDKSLRLILYCNGPFCGRSKRLAVDLQKAGYADVRRYQLGIPTWRAIGGATQVEKDALVRLLAEDRTAVLVDARDAGANQPKLENARSIPLAEAANAKDDGRLPMTDHATRIFVVGDTGEQARAVATAVYRDAFHNVSFFDGSVADVPELVAREP